MRKGAIADVLIFEEGEGEFEFLDTHFRALRGARKLKAVQVIRKENMLEPGSYPVQLRSLYESDYAVFRAVWEGA